MNKARIPVSALDLAMVPQGGNHATAIQRTVQTAQYLEELGYNRIWLAEHHNMEYIASSATAVLMTHVAQQTKSIRVGSGGIMLPNHSTLAVAEQFGTMAAIFPDRIDMGLGRAPGTDGKTAMALRGENYKAFYDFEAHILTLRNFFENTDTKAPVRAFPGEGAKVPFYILGSSTDSAYLSAKLGLPYAFAAHFAPQQLSRTASIYQANFQASEYCDKPYFMVCVNAIVADDEAYATYLSSSLFQQFLNILTNNRGPLMPPITKVEGLENEVFRYQVESMLACTFIGTKDTLQEAVANFCEQLKVNELIVSSTIFDQTERLKSFRLFKEMVDAFG